MPRAASLSSICRGRCRGARPRAWDADRLGEGTPHIRGGLAAERRGEKRHPVGVTGSADLGEVAAAVIPSITGTDTFGPGGEARESTGHLDCGPTWHPC